MFIIPPKVRCSVSGHRWERVAGTENLPHGAPMLHCVRCGETGWIV